MNLGSECNVADHNVVREEARGVEDEHGSATEQLRDPMIGLLGSPEEALFSAYEKADSPGFLPGIRYLNSRYSMRKVRGNDLFSSFFWILIYSIILYYFLKEMETVSTDPFSSHI